MAAPASAAISPNRIAPTWPLMPTVLPLIVSASVNSALRAVASAPNSTAATTPTAARPTPIWRCRVQ